METLISWCCFLVLGLLMLWLTTCWEDQSSIFPLVAVMVGLSVTVSIVHTQLFRVKLSQLSLLLCYLVYPASFVLGRLHADQSPRGQSVQGECVHVVSGQEEWRHVGKVVLGFSQLLYLCLMLGGCLGGCQAHEEWVFIPVSHNRKVTPPSSPPLDLFACGENTTPREAFPLNANEVQVGEVVSCLPIAVCGEGIRYARLYKDVPLTPGPYATQGEGKRTFTLKCLVENCGVAPDTTRCRIEDRQQ